MEKSLKHFSRWLYPLIGTACGLFYVILDEGLLDQMSTSSATILVLHEFMDAVFPVLLGFSLGFGVHLLRRRKRLIQRLSMKNEKLRKDLISSTLLSQILHEIRNPLHNISAALEDELSSPGGEKLDLIKRNLEKIELLKKRYSSRSDAFDAVDPKETTDLAAWFEGFAEDRLGPLLNERGVRLEKNIEPLRVRIHGLFLEQTALSLFGNAFEALDRQPPSKRRLIFTAETLSSDRGKTRLCVKNSGLFSQEVLDTQGRQPLPSRHGFGLGLVLVRKMIEQAGGEFHLLNDGDLAAACITLQKAGP